MLKKYLAHYVQTKTNKNVLFLKVLSYLSSGALDFLQFRMQNVEFFTPTYLYFPIFFKK